MQPGVRYANLGYPLMLPSEEGVSLSTVVITFYANPLQCY